MRCSGVYHAKNWLQISLTSLSVGFINSLRTYCDQSRVQLWVYWPLLVCDAIRRRQTYDKHHLIKNGSIPQTNTPLMSGCWPLSLLVLEKKQSIQRIRCTLLYLLFTRRAVVATETLISPIASLHCAGCRAYSPDLLSYLDAVVQDMHAILAHLLYFRRR